MQDFVAAAAKMVETKSFLTKGSNDRPRATAPMTRFRITHGSLSPWDPWIVSPSSQFPSFEPASSRCHNLHQFSDLSRPKVGKRKLRGFSWQQEMGDAGRCP